MGTIDFIECRFSKTEVWLLIEDGHLKKHAVILSGRDILTLLEEGEIKATPYIDFQPETPNPNVGNQPPACREG